MCDRASYPYLMQELRDLKTRSKQQARFRSYDMVNVAMLEERKHTCLYREGEQLKNNEQMNK
jgi:translation elongation factor P/translation initiation factor 5A